MPLSDVNQVTNSLNTLQLRELSNLSNSVQHINTLGKSNKHASMSSSSCVLGRQGNQNAAALSPEEGIVKLLERTKYTFVQENGQRRYGPPPNWRSEPPPRGCEVFIGKIPRDCFEDELIPVFEKIGPIYMFRLMMEFNGSNRGYGFCVYTNREDTKRAVQELDNYEIRKGKTIGVCFSVDNCRLFVGGIPKSKTRDEILTEMKRVTEGVKDVISYPSVNDKSKNRGFAFVEYESHKAAAMARRKLIPGRIQLWGQQIAVDWAEPEREVNEDIMSKVKILYVRNLMVSTTEESLREHFIRVAGGDANCVERVKKINDYAFIHFKEREQAAKCLQALNDTTLEGSKIEVTWAKPVDKNEVTARQQSTRASSKLMNELVLGKDLSINNSLNPAAMVAATGLLPPLDSTLPFILSSVGQQPLAPDLLSINPAAVGTMGAAMNLSSPNGPRTNSARTGRRNAAGSRSAGMQRDRKHPIEKQQQRQINPFICYEILEELARHGEWGPPIYTATPVEMIDPTTGAKLQFFMGQVILPNLRLQYAAPRYYSCPEEAKLGACEAAILNIQYNLMMPGDVDLTSASPSVRDSTIQPLLGYHDGKSLSLSAPTALPAPPCGTIHSSNTTFMPVTSNSLNLPGAPTSAESVPNNTTASTFSRTVPDSSMLVSLPNIVSSNHRDPVGSYTVMGSGPNVTPSSGQQTAASSCTPSASNLPDQNQNGSTRTETVRTDKIALASNAVTTSRPCAYFCAQANSTFSASQFGSPANPQVMCAPTQSNTAAGIAIQPNLASSMPQVAYAPYASYRTIPGPPPVAQFQSINYPSCTAFTGNYMLPVGSNVVTSAPAFLPIPLQNAGSNASNALGLLQTQSNSLPISTPSNISTQATIALNSSVVLPDCPSHLAMNGYEYSPLIPGSLATTNLVNPYGNPSAYLVDSNTVLMGSNGQLSGLPSVVTMPQTSVSGTADLIHHASIGQSGPLSTSQVPQTGLYRLSLPVHAVQTPSTQLNSVTQNQAALLGLLSQTQTQSVLPSHSSSSCPTGSVSAAQTIPATGSQSINVPAAV